MYEVVPLSADEIYNLLIENFSSVVKDVKNIDKIKKAIDESENLEDGYEKQAEKYFHEQIIAGEAYPLKKYYNNPTKENLLMVKSRIGKGIDPEFSPLGIAYLKDKLKDIERNERQEDAYQILLLQERILATPDETWEDVLQEKAEFFEEIKRAPDDEDRMYDFVPQYLWYYKTLNIEGDTTNLLNNLIKTYERDIEETADCLVNFGISEIIPITLLGSYISSINYLKERGLENYMDREFPYTYYHFSKKDNAYLMRFFLLQGKDNSPNLNKPEEILYKNFSEWTSYLSSHELDIKIIDEKIMPIRVYRSWSWSDLQNLLDQQSYSFAKEHVEFPWTKHY